jgi:branched-subunit amino acid aminotransferase/4-amino-4-deoxychorismate lyase
LQKYFSRGAQEVLLLFRAIDNPPTKNAWKKMVNKAVDEYWIEHIKKMSTYFKSLGYLNNSNEKVHAALASVQTSARDIARLPVKLRLMTGTYYLQSNKAAFNQNMIDPI